MALLIAFVTTVAGAGIALAMFPTPPAPQPAWGGQDATHAQNVTGRTLGHYHGTHARQGRHGSPATAPARGVHTPTGRHQVAS